jgi:phage tail P2-like protein
MRDSNGEALSNSNITELKFFVTDAPDPSIVAGEFIFPPPGTPVINDLIIPQLSRFTTIITDTQLDEVSIDPKSRQFYGPDGFEKDSNDATEGDTFEYTLIRGGTSSTIPYYPDADYYDLSLFIMDVTDLPRPKRYQFVWQCRYYRRANFQQFVSGLRMPYCISQDASLSQFGMAIDHPGDVHEQMYKRTPSLYFDSNNFDLAGDPLLKFYRPFADLLQDIFDEQTFINGINHIDKIPAQLIPYLAFIIGWDLPNYIGVTDRVRRSILRYAVYLQRLKGSRRAITELFEIFGFTADLINLWYATDGSQFVAPDEPLPNRIISNAITTETVCQIEPLVCDYSTKGFGKFTVPLMYRTTSDVTVTAWLVKDGPSRIALNSAVSQTITNPDYLSGQCYSTQSGFLIPQAILDLLPDSDLTLLAMSEVLVNHQTGIVDQTISTTNIPLIGRWSCIYDSVKNLLYINFDHYLDFAEDTRIFIFATYSRDKLIIPASMHNLHSNHFDIHIFSKDDNPLTTPTLDLLMNFVFKLKAFHSLLRKIIFETNQLDVYNVRDYCREDAGNLQVPPPIIPYEVGSGDCIESRGFKDADLALRSKIYDALLAENQAWRALDGTHQTDPALEHYLNVPSRGPESEHCQFTQYGQDRIEADPSLDLDRQVDTRTKVCTDQPINPDNCFKGRVQADLKTINQILNSEVIKCKPCPLGFGIGSYWLYSSDASSVLRNGFGHYTGQRTFSSPVSDSRYLFLGKQIHSYNQPIPRSLHYTNRPNLVSEQLESNQLLAYRRPSLKIEKDNWWYPGHRFVFMVNLESDYISPDWQAKPWDYSDNNLNAHLVTDTHGHQWLVYDNVSLIYVGNGQIPDISSFGSHDLRHYQVTHKIYVNHPPGNPAITLDDNVVGVTPNEAITFDSTVPYDPLFKSYNPECNSDYKAGYPALWGYFDVDLTTIDFPRDASDEALAEGLGLPRPGSVVVQSLFTFASGILLDESDSQWQYYRPYRLDCDCGKFPCGSSGISETVLTVGSTGGNPNVLSSCMLQYFTLPDGTHDFNCDQLAIEPRIILEEKLGICSNQFNGQIPNHICIKDGQGLMPDNILPEGQYLFRDEYDTIYEGSWIFKNGRLDIISIVKTPYVWGQPIEGYVDGGKVYRKGIITTTRQAILVNADGSYEVIGYESQSVIDFFLLNAHCNEQRFNDNFCYHYNCMVVDDLQILIWCGPHWSGDLSDPIEWSDLLLDTNGVVVGLSPTPGKQTFYFMNVWDNNDFVIDSVCPGTSASGSIVSV